MTRTAWIALLLGVVVSMATACPPPVQNWELANRVLANLKPEIKSDAAGKIVYLDISEQDAVTDSTLVALPHLPHLKELYLIFCPIEGDGLANIVGLHELETLDLYATHIDDRAMKYISKVTSLKYLDIMDSDGAISDDSLALIAKLRNLETLRISGTITDQGLRHLVGLKKLRVIEIASPKVTEDGIEWLQCAMPELEIE